MKRMRFFTIKYSNNQNLKCSSSPGDPGCGRPAQGEVELPWCLHSSLLLPGELRSIMMMILMFMVMMTTHDLRISWLSRYKWRLVYIVPNSSTPQVYVGGAPRTGNHGARPGSPPRLYQLVRIGISGVLFSHFHWQEHLSRHHTFQVHEIEICQQLLTTGTSSSKLCWLPAQGERLKI